MSIPRFVRLIWVALSVVPGGFFVGGLWPICFAWVIISQGNQPSQRRRQADFFYPGAAIPSTPE